MKTWFSTAGMSIAVFAVVIAVSTNLKADDAQPSTLYARAMLVRIPADEFQPILYDDGKEMSFPTPMDIAMSIFGGSNTEQIRIAEVQLLSGQDKSCSGETASSDRVQIPTRRLVYNGDKSYYLIENIWSEEKCSFKVDISRSEYESSSSKVRRDGRLDCRCAFSYQMPGSILYEKLGEQTESEWTVPTAGDRLLELTLEFNSDVSVKTGQTAVVSCQRAKGSYWVLLLNISEYAKAD